MSVAENDSARPVGQKDQLDDMSLKAKMQYASVENEGTPGLSDEEEDPHVSFKTWVVVWVSISL